MKNTVRGSLAIASLTVLMAGAAVAKQPTNPSGNNPQSSNACNGKAIVCAPEIGTTGAAASIALVLAAGAIMAAGVGYRRRNA